MTLCWFSYLWFNSTSLFDRQIIS